MTEQNNVVPFSNIKPDELEIGKFYTLKKGSKVFNCVLIRRSSHNDIVFRGTVAGTFLRHHLPVRNAIKLGWMIV